MHGMQLNSFSTDIKCMPTFDASVTCYFDPEAHWPPISPTFWSNSRPFQVSNALSDWP